MIFFYTINFFTENKIQQVSKILFLNQRIYLIKITFIDVIYVKTVYHVILV